MRAVTRAGLIVAAAAAVGACDPYYPGYDPAYPGGGHPAPGPGYPAPGPGPGYPPQPGQYVETIGCVVPGVEARCSVLRAQNGQTWNISGAQPPPPAYSEWAIRATGRAAVDMASFCQQGMVLSEVRWDYTNLRCREGRIQGY